MVPTSAVDEPSRDTPDPGTFEALGMLIHDLARTETAEDVYAAVAQHLPEVVAADQSSIALFHTDAQAVEVIALGGEDSGDTNVQHGTDNLAITVVVQEGAPISAQVTTDSHFADHRALAESGIGSVINVPMTRQGDAYGTLNVGKNDSTPYTKSALSMVAQIGDLVTVALDRIQLQSSTLENATAAESYASRLETLYDVSQELASATTEDKVHKALAEAAQRIVPHDRLSIARVEPNGMDLRVISIKGDDDSLALESTMPMSTTVVGRSVLRGRPLYTPDMNQRGGEDAVSLATAGIQTGFSIPMRMSGKIVGALTFAAKEPNAFSKQDRDLLTMFARLMSSTLERVKGAALLDHQARHDDLTELPNRREFHSLMEQEVKNLTSQYGCVSLLVIDIDHFKAVNDSFGHQAGDALLVELAAHLRASVKDSDVFARLSGDEFAVLLRTDNAQDANGVAERLRERAETMVFESSGRRFPVTVSIGIVGLTAAGALAAMRDADAACNRAKRDGRNRVVSTLADANALADHHEGDWVTRIDHALRTDSFELYAQPIIPLSQDPASDQQWAYEVLVRMRSDDGVLIPPGVFIPVAEHFGLIRRIDEWVLRNTLDWLSSAIVPPMGMCSINVSAHSLESSTFLENVLSEMDRSTVDPTRICFEITETAAVRYVDRALNFIAALSELGCQFALDDFGSGFSSFATLKRLPVDFIKIDGGLVLDICTDNVNEAAVRAIQALADALGIVTIAEFVEDDPTRQRLTEIGVTYGQGYGLGRPQPLIFLSPDAPK